LVCEEVATDEEAACPADLSGLEAVLLAEETRGQCVALLEPDWDDALFDLLGQAGVVGVQVLRTQDDCSRAAKGMEDHVPACVEQTERILQRWCPPWREPQDLQQVADRGQVGVGARLGGDVLA
jgi:hypothetical protein